MSKHQLESSRMKPSGKDVRRAAQIGVKASMRTGNILPRRMYELAGIPAPLGATDELQKKNTA